MGERWRVGGQVGRTIYLDGQLVGLMDTRELAREAVDALKAADGVLTWHAVDMPDDYPGTPVPLFEHVEWGGMVGEFRLSTREVPAPVTLMKGVEPGAPYANATSLPDCGNADPAQYCVRPAGHDGDHFGRDGRFFSRG